jgi:hypothetical protein
VTHVDPRRQTRTLCGLVRTNSQATSAPPARKANATTGRCSMPQRHVGGWRTGSPGGIVVCGAGAAVLRGAIWRSGHETGGAALNLKRRVFSC